MYRQLPALGLCSMSFGGGPVSAYLPGLLFHQLLLLCSQAFAHGMLLSSCKVQYKDLAVWHHQNVALMEVAMQDARSMDLGQS